MKARIIMHLDMNSYFASVEQQANPFLRGKSIGVCSHVSPNGMILASSIEAKAKGIKTACRVSDAKSFDAKVILVENDPPKYRSTTKKIFKILGEYTDKLEPYSIDEAFLDLTGYVKSFEEAQILAIQIQKRILSEVGEWLFCSVGISWTKFLAKFASDIAPKRNILLIDSSTKLLAKLKEHQLTDVWGINVRTEKRLRALGIQDLIALRNYPREKIKRCLGMYGYYLWANLNGFEINKVKTSLSVPKSIGHSFSPPLRTNDRNYLDKIIYKLCEKTGRRLRSANLEASRVACSLAYLKEGALAFSFKTPEKLFTTEEIFTEIKKKLTTRDILFKVRVVSVSVSLLNEATNQLSFFSNRESKKDLSRAMDIINNKYGEYTVVRGSMFNTKEIAKDRIGFRKTTEINY